MRPLERPQHPTPCFDCEDECRAREERTGFEERLQEAAAAFRARHGHPPPAGWAERHRARFRAWQAAKTACPDLRFGDWVASYRETVARDATDAFGDIDESRLRGARFGDKLVPKN